MALKKKPGKGRGNSGDVDISFWIMLTHHSGMLTHHVFWKSEIHDLGTMLSISGC